MTSWVGRGTAADLPCCDAAGADGAGHEWRGGAVPCAVRCLRLAA